MAILTPMRHRFWDNAGLPLSGGKVYTYLPGTTTPVATYTDSTGLVANTNPIILDSKGEASIWSAGLLKVNVTDSAGVQITGWPVDNLGQGQSSYDICGFLALKPANSQIMIRLPMVRPVTFDVNMNLSKGSAAVAATASTVFTIAKNGVNFGTMTFAIGATSATFSAAIPPAFAINDILMVTAPASADATLSDVGFILAGQITP